MVRNRQILKLLEIGERFSFNYWQKISKGCQFIRCGNERMAIVRRDVKRKIKPCDNHLYEKMDGRRDQRRRPKIRFLLRKT